MKNINTKTIKWRRYEKLPPVVEPLTKGEEPNGQSLKINLPPLEDWEGKPWAIIDTVGGKVIQTLTQEEYDLLFNCL